LKEEEIVYWNEEVNQKQKISNIEYRISNVEYRTSKTDNRQSIYPSPDPSQISEGSKSPSGDLGVPFILLVEDNSDLREYIRDSIGQQYQILEAQNGKQGLDLALEQIPDLVISDVMMPEMDGFELCEKLKTDERTSHIPVILLTARAGMESKIEGLETGADDFITKPFDIDELKIRIKNLVRQRKELRKRFMQEIEAIKQVSEQEILSMDQQFLRKAKRVVEENMTSSDFSAEDFANKMALSRVQLHRKLKALVDQPATGFIRAIQLNRAAELLAKHAGTVSEIAFDVGFNTLPYFTKCFQEHFGVTPSEYLNSNRKK